MAASHAPAAAEDGVPTTYLDLIGQWWGGEKDSNRDGGGGGQNATGAAVESMADDRTMSVVDELFLYCQTALGLPPWAALLLWGGFIRLCTLVASLYADRASAYMQQYALPELRAPQQAFSKVYYSNTASARQVQLAAIVFKSERRRVYRKYHTSLLRCMTSLAGTPLVLAGLMQVSSLCSNPFLHIGTSALLWCPALTLPDPLCVLPVMCCALTLLNLELSLPSSVRRGWVLNLLWVARVGCLCIIPVASSFRAGVCLYFVGMNIAGLLQPLMLRSHAFRRRFGFPPHEATSPCVSPHAHSTIAAKHVVEEGGESMDSLQLCLTAQLPYLSHMLHPVGDHEQSDRGLLRRAEVSRVSGPPRHSTVLDQGAGKEGVRRHYVAGSNPLMREQPLSSHARAASTRRDEETKKMTHRHVEERQAGKGSGWKAPHAHFTEDDFVVEDDKEAVHKSGDVTARTRSKYR